MRGFIDDRWLDAAHLDGAAESQSAFMRGFIDDEEDLRGWVLEAVSQSAFMRGFIDDGGAMSLETGVSVVSIRVHARLHR